MFENTLYFILQILKQFQTLYYDEDFVMHHPNIGIVVSVQLKKEVGQGTYIFSTKISECQCKFTGAGLWTVSVPV